LHIDRLYVGGGNAKKLTVDLGHRAELVDNSAGILGGIKLWELDEPPDRLAARGKGPTTPNANA
jgi:polyphosphate glucokinase